MRPAQKSNRSRGRGNRKSGGGGGNSLNRVYDSAGPEGKVRGTPAQIIEKYLSLARDAQTAGDRVTSENFLQHAEHYQRLVIQANGAQEQARKEAEAAQQQSQPEQSGGQSTATQTEQPAQEPAQQSEEAKGEIGGMAMIDADPSQSTLVEDANAEQTAAKRPNGDGRRRRSKPKSTEAAAATPDSPETVEAQPEH